jgi:hypothetical protein
MPKVRDLGTNGIFANNNEPETPKPPPCSPQVPSSGQPPPPPCPNSGKPNSYDPTFSAYEVGQLRKQLSTAVRNSM